MLTEAAKLTDTNLDNVVNCFRSNNSYYRLLVEVFSRQVAGGESAAINHLNNFWLILPPLYVNFVESMMASKERLNKNNVDGARMSDDGFAVGIHNWLNEALNKEPKSGSMYN